MLVVHAHPDDETLTSGALLATWAAAGLPATVVTCTRGERGEVIGAALAHLEGDGPALARHREGEIAAAARALSVTHLFLDALPPSGTFRPSDALRPSDTLPPSGTFPPAETHPHSDVHPPSEHHAVAETAGSAASRASEAADRAVSAQEGVRYEDSGMAWVGVGRAGASGGVPERAFVGVPVDEAAGRLAGLIRELRPDLVVTYEPGGGYGHPDHVRAHEVTMRAVALATEPSSSGRIPSGGSIELDTPSVSSGPDPASAAPGTWAPAVAWAVAPEAALRAGYAALAIDPGVRAVLAAHADDRRATRESPLVLPDPDGPLPSVAVHTAPDLIVEVLPVRDRVLAALRAHATQVQAVRALDGPAAVACFALSNLVLAPVLPVESYRWAPGHAPARPLPLPPGARGMTPTTRRT